MCLNCVTREAFKAMEEKAQELGVQGVAVVLIEPPKDDGEEVCWKPSIQPMGRFFREADPSKGEGDAGANYMAVAVSKLAEMLETKKASGVSGRPPRKGEFGYRGGAISLHESGATLYSAFSGGNEDQDVEIAGAGIRAMGPVLTRVIVEELLMRVVGGAIEVLLDCEEDGEKED